jgi:hypothetical protein
MTTAPTTVYLHIGLHKTGTTYLQNVLRANRESLRSEGVDYSAVPGTPGQALAVLDLIGVRPRGVNDKRIPGSWGALVTAINESEVPRALISEERLSLASKRQIRSAVSSFPDSDVHVVVTARDLARVIVSQWQEYIKSDRTTSWPDYVRAIKDPDKLGTGSALGFWLRQDLPTICAQWAAEVGGERLHLVTVPAPGAPPDLLLERVASVVGLGADTFTESPAWNNETVGVAAIEVIRRLNEHLGGRLNQRAYDKVVKRTLVQLLATRTEPVRLTLPDEELGWVSERADMFIESLRGRAYHVVGDLEELRPQVPAQGRRPDDVSESELLDTSLEALALLSEKYATAWWSQQAPEPARDAGTLGVHLASRARVVGLRGRRKVTNLADRSPVVARLVGTLVRNRNRLRQRRTTPTG